MQLKYNSIFVQIM